MTAGIGSSLPMTWTGKAAQIKDGCSPESAATETLLTLGINYGRLFSGSYRNIKHTDCIMGCDERLKLMNVCQAVHKHSHILTRSGMCSVRSSVVPRSPLFHFVTSNLPKQQWKHNCSLRLSLLLCSLPCSPPIPSASWDKWLLWDTVCICVYVCVSVCVWGGCLVVLCVINCCDSRNVCVTSAPRLESISFLFWVSVAGYHSYTYTHTSTHTHK